jgi:hypothetical protein
MFSYGQALQVHAGVCTEIKESATDSQAGFLFVLDVYSIKLHLFIINNIGALDFPRFTIYIKV